MEELKKQIEFEVECVNSDNIKPAPKTSGYEATYTVGESTVVRCKPFGGKLDASDATAFMRHKIANETKGYLTNVSYLLELGLATKGEGKITCKPFQCKVDKGTITVV